MKKINRQKKLKVYKVNFAEFLEGEDVSNVHAVTVLADNAAQAIFEANTTLTSKETKTYYAESVELITWIS